MAGGDASEQGTATCASWIRRPENAHLLVVGKSRPSSLEVFSFDSKTTSLSPSPKVLLFSCSVYFQKKKKQCILFICSKYTRRAEVFYELGL